MSWPSDYSPRQALNIGVLGGTRFIGFHLVEALLGRGDSVSIFHRGKTAEPRPFEGRLRRFLGDRDSPTTLDAFFERPYDAVIDLSGHNPRQVGPILRRWRSKIGHYLFCSTTAVYQCPPPLHFKEEAPRVSAAGTYGGDKAAVEDAVLSLWRGENWPVTVLRPQGVFGPEDPAHALYALQRLQAGAPVLLRPETLGKKLNFLWVGDLVAAFLRAIGNNKTFGQAYNVAGPEILTPESFFSLIAAVVGAREPWAVALDARIAERCSWLGLPWNAYDLVASNRKIIEDLGVTFTPMAQALAMTRQWCGENPARLTLRPQRWEREAGLGRVPGIGRRLAWRLRYALGL